MDISGQNILIIGQYLDQLEKLSNEFNAPIITGKTPNKDRDDIYRRDGFSGGAVASASTGAADDDLLPPLR